MKPDNNKISPRQSSIMIILYFFASSVITMPVFCISGAGSAGYISAFLSTFLMLVPLFLVFLVLKDDSSPSFYSLCRKSCGKFFAVLFYALFVLKAIVLSFLVLKVFSETVKALLLPQTPTAATSLVMLLLCAYMASKGIEARGRMGEIIIFLIGLPFVLIFAAAAFSMDFNNISESFSVSSGDIFKTSLFSFAAYSSFDFLLLHFHYCAQRKKSLKRMFCSGLLTSAFISLVILITTACFGTYIMAKQAAPIPEIMNVIKLPPTIIERYDLLNMFFWIFLLFWLISTVIFFGCSALKDLFKKPTHSACISIMLPFIYALSLIPLKLSLIYRLMGILNILSNVIFAAAALCLLIIKYLKGAGKENA